MAPKRKRTEAETSSPTTRSAAKASSRATRSATSRGQANLQAPVDNPEPRKRRETEAAASASAPGAVRTIIIEHCKRSSLFKTKANQVRSGLKKAVAGVKLLVNPEEPREGCFEVREDGGAVFLSLLHLEAPFQALKDLDVDKAVADIVAQLE